MLNRANFEWNANSFCHKFRHSKTAQEFVDMWQDFTLYNKVLERAEVLPDMDDDDTEESSHTGEQPLPTDHPSSSQTNTRKRGSTAEVPQEDTRKRVCIDAERSPVDQAIEEKKVGM